MTTLRAKDNFASGTIVPVTGVRKKVPFAGRSEASGPRCG
jgi:hypothetical protein